MNYYNDNNKFIVKWLKELIRAELIPQGEVDDRSITDIKPSELKGFVQCHFFAGIGGWPYALQLAHWPKNRSVWTGSCPCQPFSAAGKGKGIKDERHLWPAFRWLIAQCKPPTVFGEQVASKAGREWLAGVRLDLETMEYEVGAADLPAASVGALHKRSRLWWGANLDGPRWKGPRSAQPEKWQCDFQFIGTNKISNINCERRKDIEGRQGQAKQSGRKKPSATIFGRRIQYWPAEPAVVRVVDGVPSIVGAAVSAFGNSIVPQVAAEFIKAFMDTEK